MARYNAINDYANLGGANAQRPVARGGWTPSAPGPSVYGQQTPQAVQPVLAWPRVGTVAPMPGVRGPALPSPVNRVPINFPGAPRARYQSPGPVGMGWGVEAFTPTLGAASAPRAVNLMGLAGTRGPNVISPLFGHPGWSYVYSKPAWRWGPTAKLAPGTGHTNIGARSNRNQGFQPTGYGTVQFIDVNQYDYSPDTDPNYGLKAERNNSSLPRSIPFANDGAELVGTYRAHDSTPADRFFKQGRSSSNWQDMTFGPDYRYLTEYQGVGRYNLYNSIALVRPLSPNDYFFGYVTQPNVASQIGGANGQGRPLGY